MYYVAINDREHAGRGISRPAAATDPDRDLPVRLFRLIKNLTADGYYTSRIGLLEELGYSGNTALAKFPDCSVREQ